IYRDELFLRVYRGSDGAVLYEIPMSSCTWHEYVLVADVDGDDNAEIVAVANNNCDKGPERGVYVIGDADGQWVKTRKIWNQHTYHITNINDDGTIPFVEPVNWRIPLIDPYNNFRQNMQTGLLPPEYQPDLTSSFIQCSDDDAVISISARIGNGGAEIVAAGLPVSFYEGNPTTGRLLGTISTGMDLAPGDFEKTSLSLTPGVIFSDPITVVADDSGGLVGQETECIETNNGHSNLLGRAAAGADVTVCENIRIVLNASASTASDCAFGLFYEWREGATVVQPESRIAFYEPPTTPIGFYTYTVVTRCFRPLGCRSSDDVVVEVRECSTPVQYAHYEAVAEQDGLVTVSFSTHSEAETLGFLVKRYQDGTDPGEPVTRGIIPAAGSGHTYRVHDEVGKEADLEALTYQIIEITAGGTGDSTPKFGVTPASPATGVNRSRSTHR
ncbi:hypothetical protein ACFLU6_13110, partial [Acidobacteriota bacterium]